MYKYFKFGMELGNFAQAATFFPLSLWTPDTEERRQLALTPQIPLHLSLKGSVFCIQTDGQSLCQANSFPHLLGTQKSDSCLLFILCCSQLAVKESPYFPAHLFVSALDGKKQSNQGKDWEDCGFIDTGLYLNGHI